MSVIPIILCGGSGTRLWPLSRKSLPKQFVPLINNKSLLEHTLIRLQSFKDSKGLVSPVMCVAAEEHRFFVQTAMQNVGSKGFIILEPVAKNTAPAMALAALKAKPEDLLLFCPADHHIADIAAFHDMVMSGVEAAESEQIVTFGVTPSFPSTAYGYIEVSTPSGKASVNHSGGSKETSARKVARFIEKPNAQRAAELILAGNVLWNAGIFLVKASALIKALELHAPDILSVCKEAMKDAPIDGEFIRPKEVVFSGCRSQSIDYAVMERDAGVVVVPFNGQWSDVGSWNAVAALAPADGLGNRVVGKGFTQETTNTYIHAGERPVVALGVDNLIIIDTADALLVANADHAEKVKDIVTQLSESGIEQATQHRRVARPWGWYDSVDQGSRFQVKRIGVKPGASLSLQKHHHRAEHWIVVKGTGRITCGEKVFLLTENQSTYIPIGEVHRLENPGTLELEIIEVQSGSYLGEDDIVRLEDNYGRTAKA
jgi:mannose-1-phosphate guanylyltransferase/mannose-6-phosphate isomerase